MTWLGTNNRSISSNGASGGGATPVFNFANFAGSPSTVNLAFFANFNGSSIQLLTGTSHHGGGAYYTALQAPNSFTTQFTFNFSGLSSAVASGFFFVVQNASAPLAQNGGGLNFGGDANMSGYGGALNQTPPVNSIGIKFDASNSSNLQDYPAGGLPSQTGLYFNQGISVYPGGSLGQCPFNDLNPYGINFYTNHTFEVTIVYDGSLLTMVIMDTTTNAQGRYVWPLNLANSTNGTGNYIGFSGSSAASTLAYINSWAYWTGFNTRLATPTLSPAPGNYTTSQSVTISGPAGASIYYTTNGLLPTSSSTLYTGPITVSANQVIQAVAIESGFTDSLVASGNYVIGVSSNTINFPTGFSAGSLIPVGFGYLSGSTYRVTDGTGSTSGGAWFPVPVTVSTFSTAFTLDLENGAQGMCFVIQNNPPPAIALTGVQITGTSGQISFNATTLAVGQYVTIAGTFGGSGSISGYSNPTTYVVGATNGTTTATLCASSVATASQSGVTFNTAPQSLVAGSSVTFYPESAIPGGFGANQPFYILASGLSSTTCQLAASPGGSAISVSGSVSTSIVFTPNAGGGGAILTTTVGTPTGLTFSVNNDAWTGGPTALGCGQQALGYGGFNANNGTAGQAFGLLNSVAVSFAQFASGGDPSNSIGLYTNGANPYGSGIASGLTFNTTFNVTVDYNNANSPGNNLKVTMQATSGGTTFSYSWPINIPAIVGGNTAYVGVTGGSGGGAHAVQAITKWTM
jgi:Chitobiase/beta-hexosaminidase C-terminal domain/Legume lectin domain